jgi:hypothetical protein
MRSTRWPWGWRAAARVAILASLFAWPLATACSGSPSPPAGSGDTVIDDTRDAEVRAAVNPTPEDAGPDAPAGPTAYDDGGYEGGGYSYPGVAECGGCVCSADKHYCFGGATARDLQHPPLASADAGGDAALPACTIVDSGTPALGCNDLPAGCTDCGCVLNQLQPSYSCYLVCAANAVGQPMTVYCPNP